MLQKSSLFGLFLLAIKKKKKKVKKGSPFAGAQWHLPLARCLCETMATHSSYFLLREGSLSPNLLLFS